MSGCLFLFSWHPLFCVQLSQLGILGKQLIPGLMCFCCYLTLTLLQRGSNEDKPHLDVFLKQTFWLLSPELPQLASFLLSLAVQEPHMWLWNCWIWRGVKGSVGAAEGHMLNSGKTLHQTSWELYFQESKAGEGFWEDQIWQEAPAVVQGTIPAATPRSAWKEREGINRCLKRENESFTMAIVLLQW